MQEELNLAKNTYEALNAQLLEELPTFISVAESFFIDCVTSYIRARKIFSAKAAKQFLNLMEVMHHNHNLPPMTYIKLCFAPAAVHEWNIGRRRGTVQS